MENLLSSTYTIKCIDSIDDIYNDNIDVEVSFANGERYIATFFTVVNIQRIMEGYRHTGECLYGTYFWCSDLIIVKDLEMETIENTIRDLIRREMLETIFLLCKEYEDDEEE